MGSLLKKFTKKVQAVASYAKRAATGMRNEGQPAWESLADEGPDTAGAEMFQSTYHKEFDHAELSSKYSKDLYDHKTSDINDRAATISDLKLVRSQTDWLMTVERDFLMRRNSRIRTEAHSVAIKQATSDEKGPVLAGIFRHVQNILNISSTKVYKV